MRIDCAGVTDLAQQLKKDAEACADVCAQLETQRRKLKANSGTDEIAVRLKKQEELLEEQAARLRRCAAALGRISEVYSSGERKISDRTELGSVSLTSASSYGEVHTVTAPSGVSIVI